MQPASSDYLRLIQDLPLRPIRSAQDYETAQKKIVELKGVKENLSVDEGDYVEVLVQLVEKYERAEARAYSDE